LAAIFVRLEFAGLLNLQRFAAKSQATPHANLEAVRPSVAAEEDRYGIYSQNMPLFLLPPLSRR
jgi:hypothetical protein